MIYETDILQHHGILGQKWGVRRYQDKYGNLTPLGKARLKKVTKEEDKIATKYLNSDGTLNDLGKQVYEQNKVSDSAENDSPFHSSKARQAAGIHSVNSDTDVIKKGSTIKRITTYDEPVDSKRKYVSIMPEDSRAYRGEWEFLPIKDRRKTSEITYEIKKDMKVATKKQVEDYLNSVVSDKSVMDYTQSLYMSRSKEKADQLIKRYGSLKVGDLVVDRNTEDALGSKNHKTFSNRFDLPSDNSTQWLYDTLDFGRSIVTKAYDVVLMDERATDNIYKHFKDLGYDAIVDANDANIGGYDYPLIVLDPSKTLKQTKVERFFDD